MGFLDDKKKLIGCLLHPAQNQDRDLRDLTGYGPKCRNEICPESVEFSNLTQEQAMFLIGLTKGLDSFEYSSSLINPVFRLLLWGEAVITALSESENYILTREGYSERYPLLKKILSPGAHAYILSRFLERYGLEEINNPEFMTEFLAELKSLIGKHKQLINPPYETRPYIHQLGYHKLFVNFLRYGLGWKRSLPGEALKVKEELDELILSFF